MLPWVDPSDARYVNGSTPFVFAFGVYVNDPFAPSVSVPLVVVATRTAVSGSDSGSLSFANTPGAAMVSGTSSVAAYVSATATGGSLTGPIVMVTVTVLLS